MSEVFNLISKRYGTIYTTRKLEPFRQRLTCPDDPEDHPDDLAKGPDDLAEGPDVSGSRRAARSPDDPDDWPNDPATSTKVL